MPASSTAATTSRISFCGTRSATTPPSSAGSSTPTAPAVDTTDSWAGAAADPDDLPDQRDDPDAGGEGREHQRDRQPPVGRVPERRQRPRQTRCLRASSCRSSCSSGSRLSVTDRHPRPDSSVPAGDQHDLAQRPAALEVGVPRAASASGYVDTSGRHSPAATRSSARPARPGMPPGSASIRGPRLQPAVSPRATRSPLSTASAPRRSSQT